MFNRKEKAIRKNFEKIYDENVEQIFRFVYLKVSSKDDAEDITSRVFLRTWKSVKGKPLQLKNPKAFLYRVARNLVIDHYRKKPLEEDENKEKKKNIKKVPIEDVLLVDKKMRPDEKAVLQSQIEEVRSALKELNEDYQNVIIWYYLDELTTFEIAELLEKPESSVRVLIHRAVTSLKKKMEEKKK